MKLKAFIITLLLLAAGCSTTPTDTRTSSAGEAGKSESTEDSSSVKLPNSTPRPTPPPEEEVIDSWNIGDLISMPSADITVKTLEQRDHIEKSSNFNDGSYQFEPDAGERLWYVDMEWINNSSEVVSKECHGPYSVQIYAFDIDGNEMMMVDQPGYITDQECSTGLMTGQTGRWQTAFRSLDSEFGWIVFDDYEGALEFVTLDPHLELSFDPSA